MTIPAIFEHGVFRPLQPISLPEGTVVDIAANGASASAAMRAPHEPDWAIIEAAEACQPDDPAACAAWVEELRALPAPTLTEQEVAEWQEWRRRMKEFNLRAFFLPTGAEIP